MRYMKLMAMILSAVLTALSLSGCHRTNAASAADGQKSQKTETAETINLIYPDESIEELQEGLAVAAFRGNDGFENFLAQGGASDDSGVVRFLIDNLGDDLLGLLFGGTPFGCSTLKADGEQGEILFGRNFDWNTCNALIIQSTPESGYASISTVNRDFIDQSGISVDTLPDNIQTLVSLYAPLDGMNEAGLAVSVNMIQDGAVIDQNTDKPDLTTTTAIRLLLNQAADVEEALELLEQYDMHSSMGMMVHFAIADAGGRSVAVEYVNNGMVVTETPVVTNFYLSEGEKYGIGTEQSHTRYEILMDLLSRKNTFTMEDMRDAMSSVSKQNFGEFESTEWSIIFDLTNKIAWYYHRENYDVNYSFEIGGADT